MIRAVVQNANKFKKYCCFLLLSVISSVTELADLVLLSGFVRIVANLSNKFQCKVVDWMLEMPLRPLRIDEMSPAIGMLMMGTSRKTVRPISM